MWVILASVILTWTAPTTNEDNTPLTDLSSYEIHSGCTSSGAYDRVDIVQAPATTFTVNNLVGGTCYFAAKATNTSGQSSVFSNEAITVFPPPEMPGPILDTAITWKQSSLMAITHVTNTSNSSASTNSLVVTHGMTILEDDAIIALVHMNNTGVTVTSSGFVVSEQSNGAETNSYAIMKKDAGASEGSTFTFAISSTTRVSVVLLQLRGASALVTDVFPAASDGLESGSNSTEGPDITVANNSIAIVWHLMDTNAASTITSVDNSYTLGIGENDQLQHYGYRIFATGAATGVVKLTGDVSTHTGYHFSYKEGAGGGATSKLVVFSRIRGM